MDERVNPPWEDEYRRLRALNAELLEALEELEDAISTSDWATEARAKARAAIAKAKGET